MTTKADALRSDLRTAGYNARQVTVRRDHSTLRVTIRDASVKISHVKEIAGRYESVSYCQASGEILSGGNTFVDVEYIDSVIRSVRDQIADIIEAAGPRDAYIGPAGIRATVHDGDRVFVNGKFYAVTIGHASTRLAEMMLDAGMGDWVGEGLERPAPVASPDDAAWLDNLDV